MYQALYRKYRPKSFDDVVGQEHITTTLRNEVSMGRPAHAYLLMGSRGTGKTTCAKLIAKAVNCLTPKDGDPCGECECCLGVDSGALVDVTEIDAASNNGVDNIRDLREEANFLPTTAKYRVYIIDEVHMLSIGAVNALLKIMEEPPAHVIFILATTEVHKVPATIQSRCQRFDFKRIDSTVIARRLAHITSNEDFSATDDALLLIGRLADGGMRDAISMLDLCSSHSNQITIDTVGQVCGLIGQDYLFDLADAITDSDFRKAIETIDTLSSLSVEYDRLCRQLLNHYRNLLMAATSDNADKLIIALPEVIDKYRVQAKRNTVSSILHTIKTLQDTIGVMLRSDARRTELEICVAKLCNTKLSVSTEALLARIEELEAKINALQAGVLSSPVSAKAAIINDLQQRVPSPTLPNKKQEEPQGPVEPMADWQDVLARLGKINPALKGALVDSDAFVSTNRVLIDCENPVFREMMRSNEYTKNSLKQAIVEVTGKKYGIGPYERPVQAIAQTPQSDELDTLLANASEIGIDVEIK